MDATIPIDLSRVARRFKLQPAQVEQVVRLLEEGNTSAFIARYRKDQIDGLNESQVRAIEHEVLRAQQLAHRKESVIRAIQSQSKLTDELASRLEKARDLRQVDDLFLPFRPQREELATLARDRGLAPLAAEVFEGKVSGEDLEKRAADFVDPDRKLDSVADVQLGVAHILAEDLSDNASLRGTLRRLIRDKGILVTRQIGDPAAIVSDAGEVDTPPQESDAETATSEPATSGKEASEGNGSAAAAAAPTPDAPTDSDSQGTVGDSQAIVEETPTADAASSTPAADPQTPAEEASKEEAASPAETAPSSETSQSSEAPKAKSGSKKKSKAKRRKADKQAKQFAEFFEFRQPLGKLKPHQILTINRGERMDILQVDVEIDSEALCKAAEDLLIKNDHPHADFLKGCLRDAVERLARPSLIRDLRRELTDKAEEHAIDVFACNLRNLLLQPPVIGKRVLAIDPTFKSGSKLAAIDADGNLLAHGVLHIVGNKDRLAESRAHFVSLVREHQIDVIAIGNGTASRETEQIVTEMFERDLSAEVEADKLVYLIVNKAGAGDYATSQIGREEFPDIDAAVRSAIFLGRRLLDPLAELVKVDPASIGVGLSLHDIGGKDLGAALIEVVASCVNHVGVDLNRASASLLRYVSGLNPLIARRIFEHRQENGPFTSRQQLFDVTGFAEDSFVQAAGFLRIPDAENKFDAAWIHPESYDVAEKIKAHVESNGSASSGAPVDAAALATELGVGVRLVRDIVVQLKQPGRDPRQDLPAPIFRKRALKLEDLSVGQELRATVLNVVDFGVFVDIGLKDSALIHVSKISANYVSDPHKIVAVGDAVQVWITAIDAERGRVTLTMVCPNTQRPSRGSRSRRGGQRDKDRSGSRDKRGGRNQRSRAGGQKRSAPPRKPKPVVPITKEMLKGDEPMRTFGDLMQFVQAQDEDGGESKE